MEKRIFIKVEKLKIFKEASEHAVTTTLEKSNVFPASHYSWKKKFKTIGKLEKENRKLKDIVIQKELEGKLKDELLKKKWALEK